MGQGKVQICEGTHVSVTKISSNSLEKPISLSSTKLDAKSLVRQHSVLALDLSMSTGWALFRDGALEQCGRIELPGPAAFAVSNPYPENYLAATQALVSELYMLVAGLEKGGERPVDKIVIEEVNKARSRYSQKTLDFIHCQLLQKLDMYLCGLAKIEYVNTSDWRRVVGTNLTKDDKKQNSKLSKGLRSGKTKKDIGIKGKVNKKHVAVRFVNETFGMSLLKGDDDIADAICQGLSWLMGVEPCDGK